MTAPVSTRTASARAGSKRCGLRRSLSARWLRSTIRQNTKRFTSSYEDNFVHRIDGNYIASLEGRISPTVDTAKTRQNQKN